MTADGDAASQTRLGAEEGTDDRPVPTRTRPLVLATNNAKKLTELRRLVAEQHLDLDVLGLADVTAYPEPAETERTFEGNALLKARACRSATGYPALADDSGIEVDLLNKMPGVRSARWAGPGASDQQNLDLLLAQLSDTEPASAPDASSAPSPTQAPTAPNTCCGPQWKAASCRARGATTDSGTIRSS